MKHFLPLVTFGFIAVMFITVAACTPEMRETFGQMFDLQSKLADKFQQGSPNINIGGNYLVVSFVNCSFGDLPEAEKRAKAREIAQFVKANYGEIKDVAEIVVVFAVQKNYLIFRYSSNMDAHRFSIRDLNDAST